MKRFTRIGLFLFIAAVLVRTGAEGASISSILNTKHDLSSSSSASIRSSAMGSNQVCVFCHTPHSARRDAPLWNRTNVTGPYTPYSSDILLSFGMAGEDPSSQASLGYNAHVKTRICLSCHDGTIALGNLVNIPSPLSGSVSMQGAGIDAQGRLLSSAAGFIGLNLSDDHPVAIKHDSTVDTELTPPDTAKGIWLYDVSAGKTNLGTGVGYVECTSCHNAHDNQWGNFLVSGNDGSKVCLGCHNKALGAIANSAHDNATGVGYSPPSGATAPNPTSLGSSVGGVKCMICHFPHKAGITETAQLPAAAPGTSGKYLLSFQEDMSCFGNPNRWKSPNPVGVCHSTGGVGAAGKNIDIQTQMNKSNSAHSALRNGAFNGGYSNKHGATEQGASGNAKYGTIQTHVVCSDCHNAHTAGSANHAQGTNTITATSPLYGAAGVSYAGGLGAWAVPVAGHYNAFEPIGATTSNSWPLPKYEYEICFKCHTSFAWGGGSKPSISDLVGVANMTDQLQEFNTANAGYHPVMSAMNPANYAAPAGSWVNGWNAASLMYCSDCHGNDTAAGQPQGPHGSTNASILVRPFTDQYDNTKVNPQPQNELCARCHNDAVYNNMAPSVTDNINNGTGFLSAAGYNLHNAHKFRAANSAISTFSYRCVNCHVRIPHGYTRRGMVVVSTDAGAAGNASIYATGGAGLAKITSFNQPPLQSYATTTPMSPFGCNTVAGCHQ